MIMAKIEKQVVTNPDLSKRVMSLLSKPFDQALRDCAALKEYINFRSPEALGHRMLRLKHWKKSFESTGI
ncbi:unnamed protein product [Cladocopium goreaui]|uniref:Uncharacterized protein n=1 Tax=Cladocopium goreaui TaxID=2562237 RepID=A0A9P1GPU9_9DINO|nr:unnamed protein product [Cladocopium goreaui]